MNWFYRIYHFALKCIVIFIGIPSPKLHQGKQGLDSAIQALGLQKGDNVLVVTDNVLLQLNLHNIVAEALEKANLVAHYYSEVLPNPTIDNIENGVATYHQKHCKAIISLGGGSVLDSGKLIGARIVRPHKQVTQLKGLFKVLKRLPANIAIPTTAGTGSETTVAAVVNDPQSNTKYAATDFCLVPHHAVLLPELTTSMPAHISATTAIDALTHAIEALLSINCLKFSQERALCACKAIFEFLPKVQLTPNDLNARAQLLLASHYAGQAFTRTSVGYVHAISHQLSAQYGTPHGLANAVLLLPVLKWYGDRINQQLALIARYCGLTSLDYPIERQADDLLNHIENLLRELNIQTKLHEVLQSDVAYLAELALKEAHPDYPVPHFMDPCACQGIIKDIAC
ncbi:iron-containing alcohol dehydrogenase [Pseudoalteromonas sp. PS5]|uniref:iron-containing alcohol dehydrogenase n=1 Tax=Pseudoalteromonas sp. PS5 TaxID=1437473 RepID=UPI000FFF1D3E|nr:iron-containing alcohol dehydrogenase [Pseudoalteromonas sp. PS5]RXE94985.1 iron-containing alcohol dehydrogenase [Pseudoalteromonas sp. PS5]